MSSDTQPSPGIFSYPPPGSRLYFNHIDSVVTSWSTFDSSPTNCRLSLWYWPGEDPWTIGLNQSAHANGTGIIPLDVADSSYYLGQLNFNYHDSNGKPQEYLGAIFNVDTAAQSSAVTWSQGVLALSTSTPSTTPEESALSTSQTFIATSLPTAGTPTSTATTSNRTPSALIASATSPSQPVSTSSSTHGSGLGAGAIAGVAVGAVLCAGLAAALLFYRLRKSEKRNAQLPASTPASFQPPVFTKSVVEKYGTPCRLNELSGDDQLLELATDRR